MDSILRIASVTGIDVELEIAGPGARSYAFVVDWHMRFILAATWFLVGTALYTRGFSVPRNTPSYSYLVALPSIAIYFLYHPVLEVLLRGQTPGKRYAGVRLVALADGGAPAPGALLIRNVFRLIDCLPFLYAIGLVTTMLTRHAVRIGDIAAGTVLVYEGRQGAELLDRLNGSAVERLGLANAQLVRELLDRWPQLASDARTELGTALLRKVGVATPSDENGVRAKLEELLA
jgi:uncharacterized RDD family membrane protein YckC